MSFARTNIGALVANPDFRRSYGALSAFGQGSREHMTS